MYYVYLSTGRSGSQLNEVLHPGSPSVQGPLVAMLAVVLVEI